MLIFLQMLFFLPILWCFIAIELVQHTFDTMWVITFACYPRMRVFCKYSVYIFVHMWLQNMWNYVSN